VEDSDVSRPRHRVRGSVVVRNEGFSSIEIQRSTSSQTLSAEMEETRLVIHVDEEMPPPSRAEAVRNPQSELIAVRPIAPRGSDAIAGVAAVSGSAGSVSRGKADRASSKKSASE
jgi:hypothetical protein